MYSGDFAEDVTVYLMFNTFTSDDPSASVTISNFANTDVHIHKDDDLTPRNNAAGITVSIDFDGITGSHMIKIDTNDNTVGGFWVTGKDYFVRIEGTTIDGATVNAVVGHFSIENRYNAVTDYDGPTKAEMDTAHALLSTAAVVGALADGAADGDPSEAETLMQYIKQLINILIGTAGVVAFPSEAAPDNAVSLAEVIRAIHADVTGLNGSAMVGTNSAALASVVGALADGAADGDPSEAETLMQYLKQLINILIGTAGVVSFPGEAAPANAVSLAEVIRAIHVDVTGLNGSAMIGTNSAATETKQDIIDGNVDSILGDTNELQTDFKDGGRLDLLIDAIKAKTDNQPAGIPKNVALPQFVFVMIDSTDHITPKTGLTVTAEIGKDGGALASATNSVAEISNGLYKVSGGYIQAEMNADVIALRFSATGADDRNIIIKTSS